MNSQALPTKEELQKLPRWAKAAFMARCARRVQPYVNAAELKQAKKDRVDEAICFTEKAASNSETSMDSARELSSVISRLSAYTLDASAYMSGGAPKKGATFLAASEAASVVYMFVYYSEYSEF